jgi:hypothetical protein
VTRGPVRRLGRLLTVLSVAGVLVLVAIPAQASAPPPSCHYTAGKLVAQTSTANRKVDVRWPGVTCTAPVVGTAVTAQVLYLSGKTWLFYGNALKVPESSALVVAAMSVSASCPHKALSKVRIVYTFSFGSATTKSYLQTNAAICS